MMGDTPDPEEILNSRFEMIRLDFRTKIEKIKDKNEREMKELEETLKKEKAEFTARQEEKRIAFEARQEQEKSKFEEKQSGLVVEANNKAFIDLESVQKAIEDIQSPFREGEPNNNTRSELECPVCLVELRPPVKIWQCVQGHAICGICKIRPECSKCPTCRQRIMGRATLVEKIALAVFGDSGGKQEFEKEVPHVEEEDEGVQGDRNSQVWTFPSSSTLHSRILTSSNNEGMIPRASPSRIEGVLPGTLRSSHEGVLPGTLHSSHEGVLPRIPPSSFLFRSSTGGAHCRQCGNFVPNTPGFIHICDAPDNHF